MELRYGVGRGEAMAEREGAAANDAGQQRRGQRGEGSTARAAAMAAAR